VGEGPLDEGELLPAVDVEDSPFLEDSPFFDGSTFFEDSPFFDDSLLFDALCVDLESVE